MEKNISVIFIDVMYFGHELKSFHTEKKEKISVK